MFPTHGCIHLVVTSVQIHTNQILSGWDAGTEFDGYVPAGSFFKYRYVSIFDQSFHSEETGEGISEGVFGLLIKPWFKNKKKQSCYVLL